MPRKKTHKEFVEQITNKYGENVYEFLNEYGNAYEPIKTRHSKCGYVWFPTPKNLLKKDKNMNNVYCPNCNGGVKTLDTEGFKQVIEGLVKNEYIVLGEYVNADTPIKMQHNKNDCLHEFYVAPYNFTNPKYGTRCPRCFGKNKRTTDEFRELVYNLEGNNYLVVSDYVNNRTHIKFKHNVVNCGKEFETSPDEFIRAGTRCPCITSPKGEKKIAKILDSKIKYKQQYTFDDCKDTKVLRFDFAVFNDNELLYLIEYDGVGHFFPIERFGGIDGYYQTKKRDSIKNEYCKYNKIKLFRIPYWEINNIDTILDKILHNQLLKTDDNFIISLP